MTPGAPPARRFVILSKPDCHLCHVMREVVERVRAACGGSLEMRDVREDPELERLYGAEIPVLLVDGRELARHRIAEAALRALLADLA